jgi:hypothetical protein
MTEFLTGALLWFIVVPLGAGLLSAISQSGVVNDRRRRTGAGWDEHDTFEVKDMILQAAAFLGPLGAFMIPLLDAKDIAPVIWWAAAIAIVALGTVLTMWYGRWSVAERARLEQKFARTVPE